MDVLVGMGGLPEDIKAAVGLAGDVDVQHVNGVVNLFFLGPFNVWAH